MKKKISSSSLKIMFLGTVILFVAVFVFFGCSEDSTTPSNSVPELTTAEVTEISGTTAQCGGTITSNGGAAVTARGVCWSTTETPTVSDSITRDSTGTGSFTSEITGLADETDYYVRAYATNSEGTGYGSVKEFTTTRFGTVIDGEGNTYQTINIGDQWWMAENLRVHCYRNGDSIPNVTDNTEWKDLTTGACCNYGNDELKVATYGRLYNWYAIGDSRGIAPVGWHVPSDEEWQELETFLGMSQSDAEDSGYRGTDEGGKLKESGTNHWYSPNTGATNESGFAALPGGSRDGDGSYAGMGYSALFWPSDEINASIVWSRRLGYYDSDIYRTGSMKHLGFSVRCVRD
ncbi:fibrobacter succinogenes major paralogous domain-containing protein [bacterium]|nr:fibrobacter succinogenes major paralogous domain-containing protein [bacterium]